MRSLAVPLAASEPWSSTGYSAIPSTSTPSTILLLVSLGVTNGPRKDRRIAEYFHVFNGPAADPLLFPASCLRLSLRAQRDWRVCLRLKGLMAAMSPARAKVTVSQRLYRALRWWRDPANIRRGQTLGALSCSPYLSQQRTS
ncbi:unnamed protein product [Arctogadus glacialis]